MNIYHQIIARYDGTANCGHVIKQGQAIGWGRLPGRRAGRTVCAECWDLIKIAERRNRALDRALAR